MEIFKSNTITNHKQKQKQRNSEKVNSISRNFSVAHTHTLTHNFSVMVLLGCFCYVKNTYDSEGKKEFYEAYMRMVPYRVIDVMIASLHGHEHSPQLNCLNSGKYFLIMSICECVAND